jgi:hypothetical protein
LLRFFPFHTEGRIGEAAVKSFSIQTVGGERVTEDDIGDVLPLDKHGHPTLDPNSYGTVRNEKNEKFSLLAVS